MTLPNIHFKLLMVVCNSKYVIIKLCYMFSLINLIYCIFVFQKLRTMEREKKKIFKIFFLRMNFNYWTFLFLMKNVMASGDAVIYVMPIIFPVNK